MTVPLVEAKPPLKRAVALRIGLGSVLDLTGLSTYRALQQTLPPIRRRQVSLGDSYQRFAKSAQAALHN